MKNFLTQLNPSSLFMILMQVGCSMEAPAKVIKGLQAESRNSSGSESSRQPTAEGSRGAAADTPDDKNLKQIGSNPLNPLNLSENVKVILRNHCVSCHGEGNAKGGLGEILDFQKLVDTGKIVPGKPEESPFFKQIFSGAMPPAPKVALSAAEVDKIRKWIETFLPSLEVKSIVPAVFLSDTQVLSAVGQDFFKVPSLDREFVRYITLSNLANAGRPSESIEVTRQALSFLLNSLSTASTLSSLIAIDAGKSIFRLDLRNYNWNAATWEKIIALYPLSALDPTDNYARTLIEGTKTAVPIIRGDWMVFNTSQPPLYHEILNIPQNLKSLDSRLGLNRAANIAANNVKRSGFNQSGVSINNRMIERHDSLTGAYWLSYDFAGNVGSKNLFQKPLGPTPEGRGLGEFEFQEDGGELIFTLPNGLHGYMLVDQAGNRIDKGPTNVVKDSFSLDGAVVNGWSCMNCHFKGLKDKQDQIRQRVLADSNTFPIDVRERVSALFPLPPKFSEVVVQDSSRYLRSLQLAGVNTNVSITPTVAVFYSYFNPLGIKDTSAELGIEVTVLQTLLTSNSTLNGEWGALLTQGGTIARQNFEKHFGTAIKQLNDGRIPRASTRVNPNL